MKRYVKSILYFIVGIFFIVYPFYANKVNGVSLIPAEGSPYMPRNPGIILSFFGLASVVAGIFTLFENTKPRKLPKPLYPYNKKTKEIILPENIETELRSLYFSKTKSDAMIKLTELTGAELHLASEFIENLMQKK